MGSGPVQLMAFGYGSGADVEERMLEQLDTLEGRGIVHVLDFLFVEKTAEGELDMLDVGDDDDYGTILAGFLDIDGDGEVEGDHFAELAESLEVGSAMALVLVEHRWAAPLFSTIEDANGVLISEGFITDDDQLVLGAEVEALDEAAEVIAVAQAAESAAVLEALQAIDAAANAVAASDAIRTAAAAEAVSALIAAGIIEQAASQEAADVLAQAGLIESAALEEAAGVVAAAQAVEASALEEASEAVAGAELVEEDALEDAADAVMAAAAIEDAAEEEAAGAVAEAAAVEQSAATEAAEAVVGATLIEEAAIEEAGEVETLAKQAEAIASLTTAEKRVLRYLGTDLTFAAIADKLHISRGAVKDRASKIYRKLGVHSRAEAAEVAEAAKQL